MNPDGIYYFSSIFAVIGLLIMIYLACRKDSKTLGKKLLVEKQLPMKEVELEDKTAIENNCEASIDQEKNVDIAPTNKSNTAIEMSITATEGSVPVTEVSIPVTEGSNTAITATPNPVTVDPSVVSL